MIGRAQRTGGWAARLLLLLSAIPPAAAGAQSLPPLLPQIEPAPPIEAPAGTTLTQDQAIARDAAEYARLYGVTLEEASGRLAAQEDSVAATDLLQQQHSDRLASIFIEHQPGYRIVVLLTGDESVPDQDIIAGGRAVTVTFRTGATANRAALLARLARLGRGPLPALPRTRGMGVDPRTGALVVMVGAADAAITATAAARAELQAAAGVPVEVRVLDEAQANFSVGGGSRIVGTDPADGRRYACTTGFVVQHSEQTGIITAAHCPDDVTHQAPDGRETRLSYLAQWGVGSQDVQIHLAEQPLAPLFFADTMKRELRPVTRARSRGRIRSGDVVCHRGESSGYSCAEVDLVDFAPPGTLCGGPCDPVWVTARGPSCRSGDSGGPVFLGTTAFGIVKGGSYDRQRRCNFYFFMSLDFLPAGWTLAQDQATPALLPHAAAFAERPAEPASATP